MCNMCLYTGLTSIFNFWIYIYIYMWGMIDVGCTNIYNVKQSVFYTISEKSQVFRSVFHMELVKCNGVHLNIYTDKPIVFNMKQKVCDRSTHHLSANISLEITGRHLWRPAIYEQPPVLS